MDRCRQLTVAVRLGVVLPLALVLIRPALGQSSSLYGPSQQRSPMNLQEQSWIYQSAEEPRTMKINDLVTVIVSEKSSMTSDGQMDRKKQGYGDLALPNWIKFYGTHLGADPESHGEPHVRGEVDNKLQSHADLATKDAISFKIACRVVDIRPNGDLVIEGNRTIKNNEEEWDYSLRGEIRTDSLLPNNTILSENVAEMNIVKREKGHVRDGYRRGWLLEWLDQWQPF